VACTEKLEEVRKYVISNQLLKSGTSIGVNVRETQNCERVRRTLFINPKLQQKELMKLNIGCFCVSTPITILLMNP